MQLLLEVARRNAAEVNPTASEKKTMIRAIFESPHVEQTAYSGFTKTVLIYSIPIIYHLLSFSCLSDVTTWWRLIAKTLIAISTTYVSRLRLSLFTWAALRIN